MCNLKSGIIMKDRVFVSAATDSHEEMIRELGLNDRTYTPDFVRAELIPKHKNVFSDPKDWDISIDQDYLPSWYVPEVDEARFREAVKNWWNGHVLIGTINPKLKPCELYYLKDTFIDSVDSTPTSPICIALISGHSTINYVRGNALIKEMEDGAKINELGNSATIYIVRDKCMVAGVFGHINTLDSGSKVHNVLLHGSIDDVLSGAIIDSASGSSIIHCMRGSSVLSDLNDYAVVDMLLGNSKIEIAKGMSRVNRIFDTAHVDKVADAAIAVYESGCAEYIDKKFTEDHGLIVDMTSNTLISNFDWKTSLGKA